MTKTYFPFDSGAGSVVREPQWRSLFRKTLNTGVIAAYLNELSVFADSSGMNVKVRSGAAVVESHYFESDAQETLTITAADPANPRIDLIVLRADFAADTIDFVVKAGSPSGSPTAPALIKTTTQWEFPLALVAVGAGVGVIAAANVTDQRQYSNYGNLVGYFYNDSGGTIEMGEVVTTSVSVVDGVTKSTVANTTGIVGIAAEQIAAGAYGRIIIGGKALIKITGGAVANGNWLANSTVAGSAIVQASFTSGSFARALGASNNGYVLAMVWPGMAVIRTIPVSGVSAGVYGSSTQVPVLTIGSDGRITVATVATIPSAAVPISLPEIYAFS